MAKRLNKTEISDEYPERGLEKENREAECGLANTAAASAKAFYGRSRAKNC
jgi:hypothetical protein